MKEIVQKMLEVEIETALEKGPYDLFILFHSEDDFFQPWQLIVSANWIAQNKSEASTYLRMKMKEKLSLEEYQSFMQIEVIQPEDAEVEDLSEEFNTEHAPIRVSYRKFFGYEERRAFIITAKKRSELTTFVRRGLFGEYL